MNLYIVQQHSENDNGRDRIRLFEEKQNAIDYFKKQVEEYTNAYGNEKDDEKWDLTDDGVNLCAKSVWTLPDETTAEVFLSDCLTEED
jgi:hypothetical protein